MAGESQREPKNEPDPTTITTEIINKEITHLRELIESTLRERDLRYTERFSAQALAVKSAFESSEKAIDKAEMSIEKRADATYVSLQELSRSLAELMPRSEAESRIAAVVEQVLDLKARQDKTEGKSTGSNATIGYFIAVSTLALAVVVVIVNVVLAK